MRCWSGATAGVAPTKPEKALEWMAVGRSAKSSRQKHTKLATLTADRAQLSTSSSPSARSGGTHGSSSSAREPPREQSSSARVSSSWRRATVTAVLVSLRLRLGSNGSSMLGATSEVTPSSHSTTWMGRARSGGARKPRRTETASFRKSKSVAKKATNSLKSAPTVFWPPTPPSGRVQPEAAEAAGFPASPAERLKPSRGGRRGPERTPTCRK
mmetsp:Transcript_76893/g.220131  ORF Transcript_76893/g.220131 Transcript_76893/m.220131 type:complete len:213 (-) Transcript_76893:301-939(-)